jgi:hypothetical protein
VRNDAFRGKVLAEEFDIAADLKSDNNKTGPALMNFSAQGNEILHGGIARDQFPGFRIEWSISHWSDSSWDLNLQTPFFFTGRKSRSGPLAIGFDFLRGNNKVVCWPALAHHFANRIFDIHHGVHT